MKRIACLMMVCGLVLGALPAFGEGPVRTMLNINSNEFAWFRENGIEYRDFENYRNHTTQQILDALQGEDAMDIVLFDTNYCDIYVLMQSGLLADLGSNQTIWERTKTMYASIRKTITTENGETLVAFRDLYASPTARNPVAWEKTGLTEEDAPQCFTELLDFIEQRWLPMVEEKNVGNVRLNTYIRSYDLEFKCQYTSWLTDVLMECWELRKQAANEPVVFNEQEFVSLAQRCYELGDALAKLEKKPGKKSLSLYHLGYGFIDEHAYTYVLPMRINANETARVKARAQAYAVRKDSPYAEMLKQFLAAMITMDTGTWPIYSMNPALYTDLPFGKAFPPWEYDANYLHGELWQQAYRPEWLWFWKMPGDNPDNYYGAKESLRYQFAHGEITAHEFAQKLDEKIGSDKK